MQPSKELIKQVKDFWNQRPCNIRHSAKAVGSREYFDEVQARKYFVEAYIPYFAEFERWRNKKVLEIGCGIGTDGINFALAGAQVTVIELSEKSLEIAKDRARVYGLCDRIRFYCGNAEELNTFVPVETYDLIYSFGVIHHTPNPEKILEQMRRYVHSESMIKIMVYNRYSWKVFWIILKYGRCMNWRVKDLVAKHSEANLGCPVTYTFTKKEMVSLLKRAGFKVSQIWLTHIFPYQIPEYVRYRYVKVWYFRWMPSGVFRWLERCFGWHLCVTAQLV